MFTFTLSRMRGSVTNNKGFWIGWLDLLANYNSSQSMAALDSLHSLPDYECHPFCRDWLGSVLRVGYFFSFRCPLVNSTAERWTVLRMPNEESLNSLELNWTELSNEGPLANELWTNSFITSRRTEYNSPYLTVPLLFWFYPLPQKHVLASRWLAMDYSGFQVPCHNML
jgi:hypothetical protein